MSDVLPDVTGIFTSSAIKESGAAPNRANPQVAAGLAAALSSLPADDTTTVRGFVLTPQKGRNRFCDDLRAAVAAIASRDGYKVGTRTVKPNRADGGIVAVADDGTVSVLTAEQVGALTDDDRVMAVRWREAADDTPDA